MAELNRPLLIRRVLITSRHASLLPLSVGSIAEQVVVDGTPQQGVRRKVFLLRLTDAQCVSVTYSDLAGNYEFRNLELGSAYIPVAVDHTGQFEAVAAGPVTPTVQED